MLTTLALAAAPLHHPGAGWGPGIFWIIPVVFWVLVIGLIVTLIATRRRRWAREGWGGPWGPHAHGPWATGQAARGAEAVLAERFARGEVDEVEYRARLEVLRSQQSPQG
jgi:putative membrane protein